MTITTMSIPAGRVSACRVGAEAVGAQAIRPEAIPRCAATLRVFRGLQVTHFDVFLGCAHMLVVLLLWVICLCCVTEQQLTPADDVAFRDQVI
jgi:hypothetical protein